MNENNPSPESLKEDQHSNTDISNKCNKNRGSLIINIILFLGLAVIYLLFFLSKSDNETKGLQSYSQHQINTTTSNIIAFVNTDEIMDNYELVIAMKEILNEKMGRMEEEIITKQATYEKDANYFQEQVAKKSISEQSAQLIYEQLMEEQQKLIELRDRYTEQISMEEYEMNVILVDSITNFLDRYNLQHNYDYVLGYSKGGGILMAKDTFDITGEVLSQMNQEYLIHIGE